MDGKFNISKESDGLIKIAYYNDDLDMTKLTDLGHLSEDFEKLHEDFQDKIKEQEITLNLGDFPNTNGNEMTL